MALVNQAKREINVKIVYFGPGLSGKTTNLKYVYSKLKPDFRGSFKSMQVQQSRMLFFDFTPPGDSTVEGFRVRFHVYTLSGVDVDTAAWKMVLKGADGIVYVADAAADRVETNRGGVESLNLFLQGYNQSVSSLPVVLQYNKRDLPDALSQGELDTVLNPSRFPSFLASAVNGEGVLQTLLHLVKTVLTDMRSKGIAGISAAATQAAPTPPRLEELPAEPAPAVTSLHSPELSAPTPEVAELAAELAAPLHEEMEESVSVEIGGAVEVASSGNVRVPITVRCGGKTKTVALELALSIHEI